MQLEPGTANPIDPMTVETTPQRALAEIEAVVSARPLIDHAYLRAWKQGELSRDELRAFATQYFRLVEMLPRLVGQVYAVTEDAPSRRELIAVMSAEDAHRPSTSSLWLRVCSALGLFSDTVRRAPADESTLELMECFSEAARRGTAPGIGALLALTLQQPSMARTQRDSLAQHYELHAGPVREYYERMEYAGIEHSARLRHVLATSLDADETQLEDAVEATAASVSALHGWLDAASR